jgi:hypothetical protein
MRKTVILISIILAGCAHKPAPVFDSMAECTAIKIPTDDEFRKMPYALLFRYHQDAKLAQDTLATATVTHQAVDPCITVLAYKGYTIIDEAMKYAY